MTKQERLKAFEMRLDGYSWAEIASVMGYSHEHIRKELRACVVARPRRVNCIYPGLRQVIAVKYGGSVRALAQDAGIPENTLYYILPGRGRPSAFVQQKLLAATGLTYAEAFTPDEDFREEEEEC